MSTQKRPEPPRLVLSNASRQWGEHVAISALDLEIEPGERIALIGPSGCGKTTLLRLLGGSLRPSAGAVSIDGHATTKMAARELFAHRRSTGHVDQDALVIPQLSVHDNVAAGLLPEWGWLRVLVSMFWPLERERVREALAAVSLNDRQWDRADVLSGGQRQRVAIARALIANPTLVLADEPTASLDPATAESVTELLAEAARERGATLIVSTHRVSSITDHVDRVIGLRAGALVFDGPTAALNDEVLDRIYEGSRERL